MTHVYMYNVHGVHVHVYAYNWSNASLDGYGVLYALVLNFTTLISSSYVYRCLQLRSLADWPYKGERDGYRNQIVTCGVGVSLRYIHCSYGNGSIMYLGLCPVLFLRSLYCMSHFISKNFCLGELCCMLSNEWQSEIMYLITFIYNLSDCQ